MKESLGLEANYVKVKCTATSPKHYSYAYSDNAYYTHMIIYLF